MKSEKQSSKTAKILYRPWGLVASASLGRATAYCLIGGVAYLTLTVVGLLTPTGFKLVPLGGHDIWLHAVLGGILAAGGFLAVPVRP